MMITNRMLETRFTTGVSANPNYGGVKKVAIAVLPIQMALWECERGYLDVQTGGRDDFLLSLVTHPHRWVQFVRGPMHTLFLPIVI